MATTTAVSESPRWARVGTRLAITVVAVVGAVVSYGHMADLARAVGEPAAPLLPLSVDGLVVAASLAAWDARRRGEPVPDMTALSLVISLIVSVGANAGAPFVPTNPDDVPLWLVALVGAWPAVALGLALESLLRIGRPREPVPTPDTEVDMGPDTPPTDTAPLDTDADTSVDLDDDAARATARELIRAGAQLSGRELGARFGRGESWGRNQIRAVKAEQQVRRSLVAVEQ